ncbi:transglycosylase SLT domain-containing protein [bacterium]|nr:transglycosylase SLT domain-containing protein [bacterium]
MLINAHQIPRGVVFAGALVLSVACARASAVPGTDVFALREDRDLEAYIQTIDEALADLEIEEADAAYTEAGERLRDLTANLYKRPMVEHYHARLVDAAGRIILAKLAAKDMPRVIVHRGYDPLAEEKPARYFAFGDLAARLDRAPPHRRADVDRIVAWYAHGDGRRQYEIYLARLARYRRHIESVLDAYGLPRELVCVAMIESAVDPTRVSHANAAGLWQFIPSTARRYNLVVTDAVDQRFDAALETYAAAAYLRDLLEMFDGDIEAALAGYNAGEMFIESALASDDSVRSFWDLSPHGSSAQGMTIPRETYDYVARFFAAAIVYQNLAHFGFEEPPSKDAPSVVVDVQGEIDLSALALDLDLDPDVVGAMNPSIMTTRADEGVPVTVRLPHAPVDEYLTRLRETRRYRVSYIYRHKVTNYQSLNAIASEYGVSPARIATKNHLTPGARAEEGLVIHIPTSTRNGDAARASLENVNWWKQRHERGLVSSALTP